MLSQCNPAAMTFLKNEASSAFDQAWAIGFQVVG